MTKFYLTLLLTLCIVTPGLAQESERVSPPYNEINAVELGGKVGIYRILDEPKVLLLTDAHREPVNSAQQRRTKLIVIGEQEKKFLVNPQGAFWNDYLAKGRFNEESCASTNRPFTPLHLPDAEIRAVKEGDVIEADGLALHVLETPGLSRGSVTYYQYLMNTERVAHIFTGDLIYGDGKIANIYDLQDNFPEAEIGPYHGFMARTPQLIASLEKIRSLRPISLQPARGEQVKYQAIDTLIARLRAVYRNYLSTCALWWYFGEKRMNASAVAILGEDFDPAQLDRMLEATKFENPDWLVGGSSATRNLSTTRMIRSETGEAFVMDVNGDREADQIIDMHKSGEIGNVTGIFVTHYHHDHNRGVPKLAEYFEAPVYGVEPLADILERPGAYRMPCLDKTVVAPVVRKNDGETMQWNEFELTFFDFPGQTLYHNALLVRKGNERPIFFIGDSFTPTGIDDYCAWNRNLLQDGKGYLCCLEKIRNLDPSPMLVNAHVDPPFEFDTARLDYMERALRERMVLLANLLAVPEINFGLDHAWCRFDPFVSTVKAGESTILKMVITNHFQHPATFCVILEPDEAFPFEVLFGRSTGDSPEPIHELRIEPGKEQSISWTLTPKSDNAAENAQTGFISARVTTEDGTLSGHCEAVIER